MASKIKADVPTSNISTDSESTCTSYEERPPQSNDSGGSESMTDKPERSAMLPYTSDSQSGSRLDADDISTCSSASSTTHTPILSKRFPVRPGINWRKGERLEAMDFSSKWYSAKIVEIDEEEKMVMIHFDGWNQRYDEWIEMDSEKLRAKTRHSTRKGKSKQSDHKVGDHVYARWTDCKMYPGKVTAVNSDGSFDILFYDGFKKTVQGINIKTMPKDAQQQKIEIVHNLPKDEKKSVEDEMATLPKKRRSSSIYSRRERDSIDKASKVTNSATKATERTRSASSEDGRKRRVSTERRRPKGSAKKLIVAGSLFKKRDRSTSSERSKTGSISSKEQPTEYTVENTADQPAIKSEEGESSGEQPPAESITEAPPEDSMPQIQDVVTSKTEVEVSAPSPPSVKAADASVNPVGTPASSSSIPVCMSAPGTPMATPLSSMPPSPASTLSAVSSSPSTPKQSPNLKLDAPPSGFEPVTPIPPPKGKKEKKSRKQSFSPVGLSDGAENSARKRSKSTEKGVKSEQPQSSRKRSRSTNEKMNYILVPETVPPPKAFVIEPEHNHFKCTFENCNKAFRKEKLLESHIKFYHITEEKHSLPRKRRKTSSICSTDSDVSVTSRQRYPSSGSLGRPCTSMEGTTEVAVPDSMVLEGPALAEGALFKSAEKSTSIPQEALIAEESMETEFEDTLSKDEVVNCICRFNEENGLMIQCDVCLCWQHAACFDITENTLPKKYICYVCENPPGIRDSSKFVHDQDWLNLGHMAHFGFLPDQEEDEGCCRTVQATHGLVGDVHNVSAVLHGLKQKLRTARRKDKRDPMLQMWLQDLDNVNFDPIDQDVDSDNDEMSISIDSSKQEIKFESTETQVNPKSEMNEGNSTVHDDSAQPESGPGTSSAPKEKGPVNQSTESVTEMNDASDKITDDVMDEGNSMENHVIQNSEHEHIADEQLNRDNQKLEIPEQRKESSEEKPVASSSNNSGQCTSSENKKDTTELKQGDLPKDSNETVTSAEEKESEFLLESDLDLPLAAALSSEVKVEDMCDLLNTVNIIKEDPFKHCERNLLEHILRVQTEIEQRLDHIEEQVSALESADTNFSPPGSSDRDLLSDVPNLKKTLYLLQHDLVRVQRMAAYHR